jgi:hypothetical protein
MSCLVVMPKVLQADSTWCFLGIVLLSFIFHYPISQLLSCIMIELKFFHASENPSNLRCSTITHMYRHLLGPTVFTIRYLGNTIEKGVIILDLIGSHLLVPKVEKPQMNLQLLFFPFKSFVWLCKSSSFGVK